MKEIAQQTGETEHIGTMRAMLAPLEASFVNQIDLQSTAVRLAQGHERRRCRGIATGPHPVQTQVLPPLKSGKQNSVAIIVTTLALATLAGLGFAFVLGRHVSLGITRMSEAMSAIAHGELGTDIPNQGQRGELGQMAESLVAFKDNARLRVEAEQRAEGARLQADAERRQVLGQLAGTCRKPAAAAGAAGLVGVPPAVWRRPPVARHGRTGHETLGNGRRGGWKHRPQSRRRRLRD